MEESKYQKNFWNSSFLWIIILLFCIGCKGQKQKPSYLSLPIDSNWFSPYVVTNIEYNDTIYSIAIDESAIFIYFPQLAEMKYRNLIYPALKDTFQVTDTIFEKFKKYDVFVTPIPWIRNLYDSGKDNLIRTLFNNEGYLKQYYSYEENMYLIYLLFHENIYMQQRQDDGAFYITGYAE